MPPRQSAPVRSLTWRFFTLSGLLGATACGAAGGSYESASAPKAMAGPSMAYPPSPAASAAPGDVAKKEEGGEGKPKEVTTWKRAQAQASSSRLMVGDRESLPLRAVQAKVTVDGFRARVLVDYLYENDRGRNLEGTFQLRLPEEASPYFFAFGESTREPADLPVAADPVAPAGPKPAAQPAPPPAAQPQPAKAPLFFAVSEVRTAGTDPLEIMQARTTTWRGPKEARMVPREKAAFAYGDTVRQRVDPALMEWAGAGVFSARVFPLAPQKLHRVVVGYDMDLVRAGEDLEARIDLPEKVPSVVADVVTSNLAGVTVATTPAAQGEAAAGKTVYRFDRFGADRSVTVRLKKPGPVAITGTDAKVGDFFAAQVRPALPADVAQKGEGRAVFLVDTSLSSNPDRFNVWLKLLAGALEKNRDVTKKFAVAFFNVESHWYKPSFVDNTKENVDALLAYANGLSLEGATDLGAALAQGTSPTWLGAQDDKRWDLFLLSDGAATWGEPNPHALARTLTTRGWKGGLYAYQTGMAGTDATTLAHLTREAGGALFSVTGEAEIDRAVTAHRSRPWQLVDVKVTGASDVMLAGRPRVLFPGQTLTAVGRGALADGAELQLTLTQGDRKEVVRTRLGARVASALAARTYGQVATGALEELGAATEKTSIAYATHFRVVGQTCSLLMLESEADYQRYGIRPDEDAFVVKRSLASEVVARVLKEVGDSLGDPKASFLAFTKRLSETPGMKFEAPPSFKTLLDAMPAASFAVDAPAVSARVHERRSLPPALAEQLQKHQIEYDALTLESRSRLKQAGPVDALRALSSLVEESPGDIVLARDVAFSAMELGLREQAYHLLRRVADKRPYEPQTYRAMAQILAAMDKNDLALAYFEIASIGRWDARFGDLPEIVRYDYLRFLKKVAQNPKATSVPEYVRSRLERLSGEVGIGRADVVVMITWNTDATDVDLHVVEPSGEECYYQHRDTRSGGKLTRDVTQGYGPEMYVLAKAPKGTYAVRAHYFASDRNRASARTKVYATVIEGWGTPQERVTEKVVTLEIGKDKHDIVTIQR